MKFFTLRKTLLIFISLILIGFFVFFFLNRELPHKSPQQKAVFVSVSRVAQQDVSVTAQAIGNVAPKASVAIKSLVDGQLIKVAFQEGDYVKKGQVLLQIDPRPFLIKLSEAKANLAHDLAQLKVATSTLERNRKLVVRKYIAAQDFDKLKANQEALSATVKNDEAQVKDAELQLSYCTIKAPIAGRSGSLTVTQGNLIKANDPNPLLIINQISPIAVKFSLNEKQFTKVARLLKTGAIKVQAALEDKPNLKKTGQLNFIDNAVDTQSGMVQLKALFLNQDQYFWPGQFVKITLPLAHVKKALLIPTRAVQIEQNGGAYVYLVGKDQKAHIEPIVLGANIGAQTIVKKGLKCGDLVVTEGQLALAEGMPVKYKTLNP